MKRAIFLDRDNTIIHNDGDLGDPERVRLIRGAAHAIGSLRQLGYKIIVVSNQGGVARGAFTESDVDQVHRRIAEMMHESAGAIVDRFYYCPFHPEGTVPDYTREHPWRKPQPGMLLEASRSMDLDLHESWMVGDQERDIEAGRAAGCQTILITKRTSIRSKADFQAGSLAEAAAIIAQNRVRHRLTPPTPIVVTSIDRQTPQVVEKAAGTSAVVGSAHESAASTQTAPQPNHVTVEEIEPINEDLTSPASETLEEDQGDEDNDEAMVTVVNEVVQDEESAKAIDESPAIHDDDDEEQLFDQRQSEAVANTAVVDESADDGVIEEEEEAHATGRIEQEEAPPPTGVDHFRRLAIDLPPTAPPATSPAPASQSSATSNLEKTLNEVLLEFRSWRQAQQEFTPARMLAVLSVIALVVVSALLAIYLDPTKAMAWIGVTLIAEIGMLIMIALNRRQ